MSRGRIKRALSIVLAMAIWSQGLPILASADEVSGTGTDQSINVSANANTQHKIVAEIDSKRQANVKQFMLDDGSFMAVEYPSAVHYMKAGEWTDIDNSLTAYQSTGSSVANASQTETENDTASAPSGADGSTAVETADSSNSDIESNPTSSANDTTSSAVNSETVPESASTLSSDDIGSGFQNRNNDFKVRFSNSSKGNMVMVQRGNYRVAWGIDTQDTLANRNDTIKIDSTSDAPVSKDSADSVTNYNSKFVDLKNISSGCEYPNIYSGVNFKYALNSKSLKESIVLNNSDCKTQYSFTYSLGQMEMRYAGDGSIEIFDPKNPQTVVFVIPKAVMYDSDGNQSDAVDLSYTGSKGQYTVTISADSSWVTSPERAFPVTIDPTITTPLSEDQIHETYVASGTPTTNYTSAGSLLIGNESSTYGICRTYLKLIIPRWIRPTR